MTMRTRHILIGTASALALAALPLNLEQIASGSFQPASALAKNGGGNGGGHGGNGGGHGEWRRSGGNGGGHGGNGGGHGKSGDHSRSASAVGQSGGSKAGGGSHRASKTSLTEDSGSGHKGKGRKSTDTTLAKAAQSSKKNTLKVEEVEVEVTELPETAPLLEVKEQKLNARLAGLHSLNRNYHAYLNSQDPRMASIRDFVMASANLDPEEVAAADDAFGAVRDAANLGDLTTFDGSTPYAGEPTLQDLEDRLAAIEGTTVEPGLQDELDAEVDALHQVLDSPEAQDLADLTAGTDDEALRDALMDAANKNRVAQYGDDYVNDDVLDWAKDVLGVGDATGKIDQIRGTLIDEQ